MVIATEHQLYVQRLESERKLLGQLVASIVSKMDEKGITADLRRTYIQTLSAISRSGGYRLGKQLELVVPLVLQQCSPAKARGDAEMCEIGGARRFRPSVFSAASRRPR